MRAKPRKTRGFTLLEIVTAVAIMAAISAIALPNITQMFDNVESDSDTLLLSGALVEARRVAALQTYHNTYPDSLELAGQMQGMDKAYTTSTSTTKDVVSVWSNGDSGDQVILASLTSSGSCILVYDNLASSSGARWAEAASGATCNATTASSKKDQITGTRANPTPITL